MGTLYRMNFGAGKLEPIETASKGNLKRGTILQMHGYNYPKYVITERRETKHGIIYQAINLETLQQSGHEDYALSWPSEGIKGIHTEITDRVMPESEIKDLEARSNALEAETKTQAEQAEAEHKKLVEQGRELFKKYIPENAEALIVAERHVNESDLMTDYFSHSTAETIILAWSPHTKDIFSEMRKAAALIPETAHLGPGKGHFEARVKIGTNWGSNGGYYHKGEFSHWHHELEEIDGEKPIFATREEAQAFIDKQGAPDGMTSDGQQINFYWDIVEDALEHREKYSMGAGYYLKDGHSNSDGWSVQKIKKYSGWHDGLLASLARRCIFTDKPAKPAPTTECGITKNTALKSVSVQSRIKP